MYYMSAVLCYTHTKKKPLTYTHSTPRLSLLHYAGV